VPVGLVECINRAIRADERRRAEVLSQQQHLLDELQQLVKLCDAPDSFNPITYHSKLKSVSPTARTSFSGAGDQKWVEAAYDFHASSGDELSLKVGERLRLLDSSDSDWWHGVKADGTKGSFPATYVHAV